MIHTLVTSQTQSPSKRPPLVESPPYPLPALLGHDDHRYHGLDGCNDQCHDCDDRQFVDNNGWNHQDDRHAPFKANHDLPPRDIMLQSHPLQLDFPHFNGENPTGWTYKVNNFFFLLLPNSTLPTDPHDLFPHGMGGSHLVSRRQ